VHPGSVLLLTVAIATLLASRDVAAEPTPKTPVVVTIVGHGSIRLVVADGAQRPCDSSDNHILFSGRVSADEKVKLESTTGSVCVDHTYGKFRESQWAGATIWSGSNSGWSGVRSLQGSVSTEEP
jgi:hypothetical protein